MRLKGFQSLIAALFMSILGAGFATPAGAESVENKYTLIAAYIYNFTQLTTWPAAAVEGAFTVCVIGQDPFGANLDPLKSRKVNDEKIIIKHIGSSAPTAGCNILYVSPSDRSNLKTILQPLKGTPVLTMSDIAGFSNAGGMVEFKLEDGKIGIWVALSQVRVTGLAISSKMLNLSNMNIR